MPSAAPAAPRSRPAGTLYRGSTGMWSWVAHRVPGVLTFFFLFVHVLDTALVRVSPETYDAVIETYKNPFVNLLEVGLVGASRGNVELYAWLFMRISGPLLLVLVLGHLSS